MSSIVQFNQDVAERRREVLGNTAQTFNETGEMPPTGSESNQMRSSESPGVDKTSAPLSNRVRVFEALRRGAKSNGGTESFGSYGFTPQQTWEKNFPFDYLEKRKRLQKELLELEKTDANLDGALASVKKFKDQLELNPYAFVRRDDFDIEENGILLAKTRGVEYTKSESELQLKNTASVVKIHGSELELMNFPAQALTKHPRKHYQNAGASIDRQCNFVKKDIEVEARKVPPAPIKTALTDLDIKGLRDIMSRNRMFQVNDGRSFAQLLLDNGTDPEFVQLITGENVPETNVATKRIRKRTEAQLKELRDKYSKKREAETGRPSKRKRNDEATTILKKTNHPNKNMDGSVDTQRLSNQNEDQGANEKLVVQPQEMFTPLENGPVLYAAQDYVGVNQTANENLDTYYPIPVEQFDSVQWNPAEKIDSAQQECNPQFDSAQDEWGMFRDPNLVLNRQPFDHNESIQSVHQAQQINGFSNYENARENGQILMENCEGEQNENFDEFNNAYGENAEWNEPIDLGFLEKGLTI
uniref:ASXH domain-containing protein n=1 Tax=Caenorhabditis tropicalis TaxID=1561998 RepID=A0A1I7TND7_9PELO